jgi:hypothetical protein
VKELRFKIKDLVEMLVSNRYDEVIAKYNLKRNHIREIEKALRMGRWKVS